MSMEYVVLIVSTVITVAGGLIGNKISNKPKNDDNHMNRIELIITKYESWNKTLEEKNKDLKERNVTLKKENHVLREKVTRLEKRIKELEGGENNSDSKEQ